MKLLTLLLSCLFLLTSSLSQAQTPNSYCDGSRYLDDNLFPSTQAPTTVKFGENNTISGNLQELFMDIYEPEGDLANERPLVVLGFGGSFIGGDRGDVEGLCRQYARRGYVAVAIDYRLYDGPLFPFPDSLDMIDVVMKAVGDMKASIRYLKKDAAENGNTYGIDSNYVFVGGVSAGSILALHTAYVWTDDLPLAPQFILDALDANGGYEGDTDLPGDSHLGYSSNNISGVVNYFGAIYRTNLIDADDPPIVSIHGDADGTVPYGYGFAMVSILPIISMNGSALIHPHMQSIGRYSDFISVPNGGHGDFLSDPLWADSIEHASMLMLEAVSCGTLVHPEPVSTKNIEAAKSFEAFPNPALEGFEIRLGELKAYDLEIYDNLGRLVHQEKNIMETSHKVYRNQLGTGLYHILVRLEDGSMTSQKIIFK